MPFLGGNTNEGVSTACTGACTSAQYSDPELAEVVAAWPSLPEHIRLAISALAKRP